MPETKNKSFFWRTKTLTEMTLDEWELLCDGCAKCCLHKLEDDVSGDIHYTRIVCRYMDEDTCRCTCYDRRTQRVKDCLKLSPQDVKKIYWLPRTCAYRLIAEGKDLPWWHPLVSGDSNTVHKAGISVRGKVLCEDYIHSYSWYGHIIQWGDDIII